MSSTGAGGELLGVVSYLSLSHWRSLPLFLRYALAIEWQLRKTPGLIGYSTEARFLERKFWTLSVWRDDDALKEFVHRAAHGESMKRLEGAKNESAYVTWAVRLDFLPLDWTEAKAKLAQVKGPDAS
jgi:heme-degrading monooxygenase HmoA